jgi:hypothetical protein
MKGIIMPKWADYLISQVQYSEDETHIVNVMSHVDNGESVSAGSVVSRGTVVSRIDSGNTYKTITKGTDGKWQEGAAVQVITIDSVKYIKTVADNTKKDNLGSLPRF